MKRQITLLLTFFFLFLGNMWAQCPTENIDIYTQAEVDSFVANYSTCDTIFGNLKIGSSVNDISDLSFVTAIMGELYFSFSSLSSIDGLEQLTYVGGNITFFETQISDISALNHPIEIGGTVRFIEDNINLTNCAVQSFCEHIIANGFEAMSFEDQTYSCESSLVNCGSAPTTCPPGGSIEFYSSFQTSVFTAFYPNCTTYNGNIRTVGLPNSYGTGSVSLNLPNIETLNGNLIATVGTNVSGMGLVHLNGSISSYDSGAIGGTFNFMDTIAGGISVGGGHGNYVIITCPILKYIGGGVSVSGSEGQRIGSGGFPVLERIEGGLYDCTPYGGGISFPETAFPSLKYIGGNIDIDHGTISGLNMLDTIAGSVIIEDCYYPTLDYVSVAITGLNELDYVGGGGLNFGAFNCVSDLSGLCNYFNNGGAFSIYGNSCSISEADAMAGCVVECPQGDMTFTTQQEIDDFTTIPNCTTVTGNLAIQAATPGDITNLDGLSQITTIDGWLLIEGTSASNLDGLSNLTSVGNALVIKNNPALTDVSGLGNMSTLPSSLSIDNNDALIDLSGLENISQIGEGLLIFDNAALQNLSGLEGLNSIGSQLYVQYNAALTNFSGLENLTSIGTNIRLQNNSSLNTLTALSNVNMLGGYIRISGHNVLTSLGGLENIDPNSITDLILTNNPNLVVCNQVSVCTYLENGGTANITNNASGCNTQAEVEAICNDPCLATPVMNVNHQSIPDGLYQAVEEVNSTGTVPNNGTVNFKAGEVILLDNGFSIAPDADFSAEIEDCDGN